MRFFLVLIIFFCISCDSGSGLTPDAIRTGTFRTALEDNEESSTFYRDDTYQIETYNGKIDTFYIHWKSNFEYILKNKNPKSSLDSLEFKVRITGIYKDHYTFRANFDRFKFSQKGKTYKIN